MPWVKKVHVCNRPSGGGKGFGSRWRCRKCKRTWEVIGSQSSGMYITTQWREVYLDG
jgi:transposase-like protein